MSIPIKTVAVLSARVKRLERQLARMAQRRENWEKCAVRQGETIRKYKVIMEGCGRCLKEKSKLYGKVKRKTARTAKAG